MPFSAAWQATLNGLAAGGRAMQGPGGRRQVVKSDTPAGMGRERGVPGDALQTVPYTLSDCYGLWQDCRSGRWKIAHRPQSGTFCRA